MQRIGRQHTTYRFAGDLAPVATAEIGEELVIETWDAQHGRIRTHADALSVAAPVEEVNPATGPIAVQGLLPGDTLVVEICAIKLAAQGQARLRRGGGVITDTLAPPAAAIIRVIDGVVHFNERIRFRPKPMLGVIGVAPAGDGVYSYHPGPHGGNLDVNEIAPGSKVYLPVAAPGALLALGDVHARMGDGELTGGGIDIPAEVRVRLGKVSGLDWARPVVETPDAWCTCANAPTLEEAIRQATLDMTAIVARRLALSPEESFILISCTADARIGQAAALGVDVTAYLRLSKEILPSAF